MEEAGTKLEVLHDHYKETFAYIHQREKSRDRLFLVVIGLFGLLSLQVAYPFEFNGAFQTVSILGTDIKVGGLPQAALLSVTWVFTLAISLRYCQDSIAVDRQYPYLHKLEKIISRMIGGGRTYRREGKQYLHDYPLMLNVAWIAYVVVFPAIVIVVSTALIIMEWQKLETPLLHDIFDTLLAIATAGVFYLYRVDPYVKKKLADRRNKRLEP